MSETLTETQIERYVEDYRLHTGFPNSTFAIRKEVSRICSVLKDRNYPVLFSGCVIDCSLGDPVATAMPGSDIDGWGMVLDITQINEDLFFQNVDEIMDKTLIDETCRPNFILTLNQLESMSNLTQNQALIKKNSGLCPEIIGLVLMSQIRFGQTLLSELDLYRRFKDSPLFNTIQQPTEARLKRKHQVRKKLADIFPRLTQREKYTLIRTHQIYSGLPFSLYPVESPFATELAKLYEFGFYSVRQTAEKYRQYIPLWMEFGK